MTTRHPVWDPLVRVFHWSLVILFALNALILDDESKWHIWVGYGVAGLIAFRIIWGLAGSRYARFRSFPPSISGALEQARDMTTGRVKQHIGHTPLGAWMIYNLLAALAAIAISGYLMTTNAFWGVEWVEEVHEAAVSWAEISIVAHIAAVIFESRRTGVNLPRAMVTGYKDLPSDTQ
jgi:cytochrome b